MAQATAVAVPPTSSIVIALADEGVPIRAIARSTKTPSKDIREILAAAVSSGSIVQIPRDDWAAGSTSSTRQSAADAFAALTDPQMEMYCVKLFKVTGLQAAVLTAMIKRKELTRDNIHHIIEARRTQRDGETSLKMIDVVIYHLRKRCKSMGIKIHTIWSHGYYMQTEDRQSLRNKIAEHLKTDPPPEISA